MQTTLEHKHHRIHFRLNQATRIDPTRTSGIRSRFVKEMDRRFNGLKKDIRESIVDKDCFGIQPTVYALASTSGKQFAFERTADKVKKFMEWLEEQERLGILEIIRRPGIYAGLEGPWSDTYILSAYVQGIRRARLEMKQKGYLVPSFEGVEGGIGVIMSQPMHADRIAAIFTRTFEDLKTVMQVTNEQLRRTISDGLTTGLARGMAEGKNPITIARELMKDTLNGVDKIGRTRARMIARTEVIRAHHVANVAEYRRAEADMQVEVEAELLTAGDDRVCDECGALEGKTFSLDEIEGMIPVHPNCIEKETIVIAKDILAGMIAKYSGPIFELTFSNGARLSVTPNHMLATPDGFIMAKFLSQGDAVLCGFNIKGNTFGDPNNDRNPARIDNIIQAFAETPGVKSTTMPVSSEYLHGDGSKCEGDIYIVNSDGLLRDDLNTKFSEIFNQSKFDGRGVFDILSTDSSFFEMFHRLFMSPDSIVGSNREILAFLRGCICHAKKHGFTSISRDDSILLKTAGNDISIATEIFRELFNGKSSPILFEDLVSIYRQAVVRNPSGTKVNSSIDNPGFNGIPFCYAISNSQLLESFSGLILSVRLMGIEIKHVLNSSVYDLSTSSTIYFANTILSSNCRCVAKPVVKAER